MFILFFKSHSSRTANTFLRHVIFAFYLVEPIQESIVYIYIALLIGSCMDYLAFTGQSTYVFFALLSLLAVY